MQFSRERRRRTARTRQDRATSPRLIAVAGGKGGVGKTFISANLATLLAQADTRVVAVDTDLEGANLHTWLGVKNPSRTLADFVSGREVEVRRLLIDTPIANLELLPAVEGHLSHAQPNGERRLDLLRGLRKLERDFILLDCGAGTHAANVDYFAAADEAILVLHPEPTSIENAYSFLRSTILRRMELEMLKPEVQACVREAMDQRNERGIRSPRDLRRAVEAMDPEEARHVSEVLGEFRPRIVVNDVMTAEDVKLGFSVRTVCKRFFGIDADYAGYVNNDERVRRALRSGAPLVVAEPEADASVYLARVARKLLSAARQR